MSITGNWGVSYLMGLFSVVYFCVCTGHISALYYRYVPMIRNSQHYITTPEHRGTHSSKSVEKEIRVREPAASMCGGFVDQDDLYFPL